MSKYDVMMPILRLVQSDVNALSKAKDKAEEEIIIHGIPADERASTFKPRKIDRQDGTVKYYEKQLRVNRRQISAAADEILRKEGYCLLDGRPRKK